MTKHKLRMGKGSLTVDAGSPLDQAHSAGILHGLRLALRHYDAGNALGKKRGCMHCSCFIVTEQKIRAAIKRRKGGQP